MSAVPGPPRPDLPTAMLPVVRGRGSRHRAPGDGSRLMWAAVAAAAVTVLVATLAVACSGNDDAGRPAVVFATSAPAEPEATEATEEPSPTPSSSPSPSARPGRTADPAQLLAGLRATVDGLARQGDLRRGAVNDLRRRLREVEQRLAAGDVAKARDGLREFAGRLAELRREGRISARGYDVLAAGTTRLAQALAGR